MDRGHSFEPLTPYMNNVKLIVSYGETKNRIKDYAMSIGKECVVVDTLDEAFNEAVLGSVSGDTIVLSPACASWDQYEKFEDRGDAFVRLVEGLKNK